jgi:molecular chaperone GrpE
VDEGTVEVTDEGVGHGVGPGVDVGDVAADAEHDAAAAVADLEARAESDPRSRVQLLSELEQVEAQRDEYLDDLRRAHADFENYRKRVARDGAVQREQGRGDVVNALLDVLDDLDRIVTAADALDASLLTVDVGAVASGVRVVAEKAQRALAAFGVERVDTAGGPFDPTVHDAVQQVEVEGAEGQTVHEVLRPGYRLADRVLRPAMVIVAQ